MAAILAALVIGILLSQDFIDLELSTDLGPWHVNLPVADLLALVLLALAFVGWVRRPTALPGFTGYALFVLASAISIQSALDPHAALHHLLRKPVFLYLAYGIAMAWAVARVVPRPALGAGILAFAMGTAGLSLVDSALRIAAGDALWYDRIASITPNHKTLAVALAAWLPLLMATPQLVAPKLLSPDRARTTRNVALGVVGLAILLAASKTAWITALFAVGLYWPLSRPLSTRLRIAIPALLGGLVLALYSPLLLHSVTMLDAVRSRHSLDVRAWQMWAAHPLFGSGTGMNVLVEMQTFPHYRINGVDAHGVIQKVASETGLVGLLAYGAFVWSVGSALLRPARQELEARALGLDYAAMGTFVCLYLNLLLSTETFTPTHWVPFAVCWGLHCREQQA